MLHISLLTYALLTNALCTWSSAGQCQGNCPAYFSVTNVLNSRLCRDWRFEKAPAQHPHAYCGKYQESVSEWCGGNEGPCSVDFSSWISAMIYLSDTG